jgi:hypothetical protein
MLQAKEDEHEDHDDAGDGRVHVEDPSPVGHGKSTSHDRVSDGSNDAGAHDHAQVFPSFSDRHEIADDEFDKQHNSTHISGSAIAMMEPSREAMKVMKDSEKRMT